MGRKTANVVLGNAFGIPGLTVDTHFGRLVRRWGWTEAEDPVKVESAVAALIPQVGVDDLQPPRDLPRPALLRGPQPGLLPLPARRGLSVGAGLSPGRTMSVPPRGAVPLLLTVLVVAVAYGVFDGSRTGPDRGLLGDGGTEGDDQSSGLFDRFRCGVRRPPAGCPTSR